MKRYGIRFTDSRIPTVEVTLPGSPRSTVVRTFRGFTTDHAYRRALKWTRENGDPR